MNILLFGKSGQVGWELQRALAPLGNVIALDRHSKNYCGDLSQPDEIAKTIQQIQPEIIVNAAAYTAVDKAESESSLAYLINAHCVETIAKEAKKINAWVVHYSTDYVFSGEGDCAWTETDLTSPVNTYGASKLAGEHALAAYCQKFLILRTSWVYAANGNNFAKTMLKLASERKELSVINDQFGAPTGSELLADCTAHALQTALRKPEVAGIYHLAASGTTTWYEYASFVFNEARNKGIMLSLEKLNAIPSSAYPTPARRPYNSRLNNSHFQHIFGLNLPEWYSGVERMLNEVLMQQKDK
ncbi:MULTISPECIES: dTDP-4-dehydrorhamnose reductase [Pantoea]|uniref:dTDP-4-dehydrorhamnose reductase n=1 Tax=Pantoea TaxID=53335 RepID=UPI000D7521A2|nr:MULTISPECIES: dTDP-4-dehydrorhamnose reductase [Pantoea]NRH23872.1 dTDP-4-dehydrorhamnose reductase [Pantoea stewartii]PXV75691.1 dTDP-4-dehydrorhamnose reductase [Pantoea sp. PNA 03-3]WRH12757.1 dTDP-4-dehydrorhamnose reductase [Pantoea sp. JZ2]